MIEKSDAYLVGVLRSRQPAPSTYTELQWWRTASSMRMHTASRKSDVDATAATIAARASVRKQRGDQYTNAQPKRKARESRHPGRPWWKELACIGNHWCRDACACHHGCVKVDSLVCRSWDVLKRIKVK